MPGAEHEPAPIGAPFGRPRHEPTRRQHRLLPIGRSKGHRGVPTTPGGGALAAPRRKEPIDTMSTVREVTDETFDELVLQNDKPVVVDFWAAWCGPCRMVAPEVEKVATAHAGQWLVIKVDTDRLTDVAGQYRA